MVGALDHTAAQASAQRGDQTQRQAPACPAVRPGRAAGHRVALVDQARQVLVERALARAVIRERLGQKHRQGELGREGAHAVIGQLGFDQRAEFVSTEQARQAGGIERIALSGEGGALSSGGSGGRLHRVGSEFEFLA